MRIYLVHLKFCNSFDTFHANKICTMVEYIANCNNATGPLNKVY